MDEVRQGATILIMDRNKPVARLEPAAGGELASGDRVAVLVREGLAAAALVGSGENPLTLPFACADPRLNGAARKEGFRVLS